jgi:hypothetical protein
MKQQTNSQSNSQNNSTVKPNPQFLPPNILEAMMGDIKVRRAVVNKSHLMFFNFYFAHYVKYPTAQFHKEFFFLTEQDNLNRGIPRIGKVLYIHHVLSPLGNIGPTAEKICPYHLPN